MYISISSCRDADAMGKTACARCRCDQAVVVCLDSCKEFVSWLVPPGRQHQLAVSNLAAGSSSMVYAPGSLWPRSAALGQQLSYSEHGLGSLGAHYNSRSPGG